MEWIYGIKREYDDWIYHRGKAYVADFSHSGLKEVPLEKREGQLLNLFEHKKTIDGREIVLNMCLDDHEYMNAEENSAPVKEFFEFFCGEKGVLDINPGKNGISEIFIKNRYSLKKKTKNKKNGK